MLHKRGCQSAVHYLLDARIKLNKKFEKIFDFFCSTATHFAVFVLFYFDAWNKLLWPKNKMNRRFWKKKISSERCWVIECVWVNSMRRALSLSSLLGSIFFLIKTSRKLQRNYKNTTSEIKKYLPAITVIFDRRFPSLRLTNHSEFSTFFSVNPICSLDLHCENENPKSVWKRHSHLRNFFIINYFISADIDG